MATASALVAGARQMMMASAPMDLALLVSWANSVGETSWVLRFDKAQPVEPGAGFQITQPEPGIVVWQLIEPGDIH